MKLAHGLLMGLVLASATTAAAQEPVRFRFWKDVDRGPLKEEEILALALDGDVYAATREGFPDLRVVDDSQAEAPCQVEVEVERAGQRSRQPCPSSVLSLQEDAGAIEVRVRLGDEAPAADGMTFVTPLVDYERRVRVFGSQDGANWAPLVTDGLVFDYSRYMDVHNREISLPQNAFRQFKISIEDVTDEKESPLKELTRTLRKGKEEERVERTAVLRRPLRIDRIELWHVVSTQYVKRAKKADYPIAGFRAEQDDSEKQTILHVQTRREPLTAFTLQTPSRNFHRRAVVQVPVVRGHKTEWSGIGQATISKLQFRSFRRDALTIDFPPEHRQEQYRIVIHNEDNPPLEIDGIRAEGNVYRVAFLAEAAKSYRVFYGSETADTPKYEAASVLATLRQGYQPVEAHLGAQVENVDFVGQPGLTLQTVLNNWIVLGAAIGLMVAALAWGLFRAGRHLENLPKE